MTPADALSHTRAATRERCAYIRRFQTARASIDLWVRPIDTKQLKRRLSFMSPD